MHLGRFPVPDIVICPGGVHPAVGLRDGGAGRVERAEFRQVQHARLDGRPEPVRRVVVEAQLGRVHPARARVRARERVGGENLQAQPPLRDEPAQNLRKQIQAGLLSIALDV
jgi:hypothetical protein